MLPNRVCADWQKYLYCYLSGTVMVTIENQWYSAETHCNQSPGGSFTIGYCSQGAPNNVN